MVALLALFESLDLLLSLLAGRLMDARCFPIGGSQITQVRCYLFVDVLKRLLKRCLRTVLVLVVDRLELAPVNGQQFCPKEIQLCAQEDKLPEKSVPRFRVSFSEISHRLDVWSKFAQKPNALHVAMGFPLKSSAGSNPVEVSIDVELEQIPWIIGRATRACSLSPREPKPLQIKTLHIRINNTNRIFFRDIVIEKIRQKEPLGPTVSRNVAHPASLLCFGGRLYSRVSGHKEFSHTLAPGSATFYSVPCLLCNVSSPLPGEALEVDHAVLGRGTQPC